MCRCLDGVAGVGGYPTGQGFRSSPLLKLLYLRKVVGPVGPGTGYTVCSSGPNSVVELPPK
jgi:hypothetical protein